MGLTVRRADHLQCRRGRWSVRLRVPAHLVAAVGQTHLVRSLDTVSETVARERRWIALALLWEWIGAQTVSDGWEPAWAAALTGSGRSRDDTGRECPDPTPHSPPQRRSRRSGQDHAHPAGSSRQTTILTTMDRWLKEIEGVQTLGSCRFDAWELQSEIISLQSFRGAQAEVEPRRWSDVVRLNPPPCKPARAVPDHRI
ncbi:DUF6538 domain-containing protein [Methylobacterium sp. PvR107]|uniref:DUF6538 domain-containing protein n=1 Tax=Methylobacterium sp. PvR107 TaxID=2806597 RepID=UPI003917C97E